MTEKIPKEFIAGTYGKSDTARLIRFAKNAGLKLIELIPSEVSKGFFKQLEQHYDGIIYPNLGLLYLKASNRQLQYLLNTNFSSPLHFIESENSFFPLAKDVNSIQKEFIKPSNSWGIEQTNVHKSKFTGKNVHVAILDTGINVNHADFTNSTITTTSFIDGESTRDGNGHGTHCSGIIIGPKKPKLVERYGVSPNVKLFSGKVLRNSGASHSRYVFQGLEWALENKCRVISVSLGNRVRKGVSYSLSFEKAAQAALKERALIIASAGNDSYRHLQRLLPVSEPANCPSIMAVGAINQNNEMYNRSNAGINPYGGNIDLVAPGVSIKSSYNDSSNYHKLSGTSMATSFVAGIAAQYVEAFPNKTPGEIRSLLNSYALTLPHDYKDVGSGLVQAIF
jgi:subtilisin family serine protease